MDKIATTNAAVPSETQPGWSLGTRLAFRFCFIYLLLYLLPRPFNGEGLPRIPSLNRLFYEGWRTLLTFVTGRLLGWSPAEGAFNYGGGDAAVDYVRLGCCVAVALVGTAVWSVVQRSSVGHAQLQAAFRVYLRFVLGISMLGYGMAKLLGQFAYSPIQLVRPIGQLEPMQLLWMFMGYSTPYAVVTGVVEMAAGIFLFFRRTTLLGAVLVVGAMANVVALNLSYDVQVKIQSVHLLLTALVLVAPDAPGVAAALLSQRPSRPWSSQTRRILSAARALLIAVIIVRFAQSFVQRWDQNSVVAMPALYGLYEVGAFVQNGVALPPLTTDNTRWRRVAVDKTGEFAVQLMDDTVRRFRVRAGSSPRTISLQSGGLKAPMEFKYSETAARTLLLQGGGEGQLLTLELERIAETSLPLLARQFRWSR